MKKRKRLRRRQTLQHNTNFTQQLHSDNRDTLVKIDDNLFTLVPAITTMAQVRAMKNVNERPHIRFLNPIPERTTEEQAIHNEEQQFFTTAAEGNGNQKVTSMRKAAELGANVPEVIKNLVEEKGKAHKAGDKKRVKQIRKQLRKLDYKRYNTDNQDDS